MENSEKTISKVNFKSQETGTHAFVIVLWYIVGALIVMCGISSNFDNPLTYFLGWCFFEVHIIGIVLTAFIVLFPIIVKCIRISIAKNCALTLTNRQIYGQVKTLFGEKKLQMPLEHLDNIIMLDGFMDKMRGGVTIHVRSNSGLIAFHYAQNANEFVAASLKKLEEVKKASSTSSITGNDSMEKLNSLKQMLANDLISQEEFEQKKKDILEKL